MLNLKDIWARNVRLTDERLEHLETGHPEMRGQLEKIQKALSDPEKVVRSITDEKVELFYRHYQTTPVTSKFICVVVKDLTDDIFIVTAYFTDTVKRGEILWEKK